MLAFLNKEPFVFFIIFFRKACMVWCVCGGNVDYKKFDAGSAEWALHYVSKYSLLLSLFTKAADGLASG